jgi:uncharacterized membrane protein
LIVYTDENAKCATKVWWCYGVSAVMLSLFCLMPVWINTALHEYHNYDLGIFAQALYHIGISNLNPFIPALNIPLFSDHFDPILVLFAPVAQIMEPAYAVLAIEHILILLTPLPVVLAYRKEPYMQPLLIFAIVYILFNRGLLSAVAFPVHPTTWAGFFIVWVGMSVKRQQWGLLFFSSILLMSCKEEFPFPILMVGVYLAWKRHYKIAAGISLLAVAWLIVAIVIRPMLLEHTNDYASRVLAPLFSRPFLTIWDRIKTIDAAKNLFRSILPLIPITYWSIKNKSPINWCMLLMALPLLAIRFLDASWGFHYLAPVTPLLVTAFAGEGTSKVPWKIVVVSIVITILAGSNPIRKSLAAYGSIGNLHGERRNSIEEARRHLLENPEGKALVHGNLTPLLARRGDVFQFGGVQPARMYRYYLVEIPPSGDPWPLSHSDVERSISEWRSNTNLTILKDNRLVFFAVCNEATKGPNKALHGTAGSRAEAASSVP